ncbi:hypothetical protein ACFV14_10745 [Streptomyces zaomyceticus]|uniref:hypothetical protein n=1 Tax=Streptomyces zaomyceticus TaxID=68286 RepID=UPI0036889549
MSWTFRAQMFEEASYSKLYDLEFGEGGYEDGPDDWIRTMLPILTQWKAELERKRDDLHARPDSPFRSFCERQLIAESAAYQRALLKLSEAWLAFFYCWQGSDAPTSLIFELDGGES